MTASLSPGDAIGNYILTLKRLLERQGIAVQLFADHIEPKYNATAWPARDYRPGRGTLWYHYSIYSENLAHLHGPAEFRVMDYHGVSPADLFSGYDSYLAGLCKRGMDELPRYSRAFDLNIVHSEYTRQELLNLGYENVQKVPLVVDVSRFTGKEDPVLTSWLEKLSYILFVGRIVPQKDILAMLEILRHLHRLKPETVLVLVGGRNLAPRYQEEITRRIKRHRLGDRVLFTGKIDDAAMLTSLYRHARFTLVTSEWESFCVPIVESMTFGTPVVVHDIPPLPEIMGSAGLVIDKQEPAQAAETICEAWTQEDTYASLVRCCAERAEAFTDAALVDQLSLLFAGVTNHA